MADFQVFSGVSLIARTAAERAVSELGEAIRNHGKATWVLAGGTSPLAAYHELAEHYDNALSWQDVYVLMGDERCVPQNHPDSNWGQVSAVLGRKLGIPTSHQIMPEGDLTMDLAADRYDAALSQLPKNAQGWPRLDHVWLGIGEDGHTLSLFPGHEMSWSTSRLVVAVHDSPKPPPKRITLTPNALKGASSCLVFAAGKSKASIVARAKEDDEGLPIVQVIRSIETAGGHVTWLADYAAAGQ